MSVEVPRDSKRERSIGFQLDDALSGGLGDDAAMEGDGSLKDFFGGSVVRDSGGVDELKESFALRRSSSAELERLKRLWRENSSPCRITETAPEAVVEVEVELGFKGFHGDDKLFLVAAGLSGETGLEVLALGEETWVGIRYVTLSRPMIYVPVADCDSPFTFTLTLLLDADETGTNENCPWSP